MRRWFGAITRRAPSAPTFTRFAPAERFHHPRRLDRIGRDALRRYHASLFQEKKLAVGTVGLHVAALRFFFIRVLKRREMKEELPTPKRVRRLPTVLTPDEVKRLIAGAKNLYHRTMLLVLYGRLHGSVLAWAARQGTRTRRARGPPALIRSVDRRPLNGPVLYRSPLNLQDAST